MNFVMVHLPSSSSSQHNAFGESAAPTPVSSHHALNQCQQQHHQSNMMPSVSTHPRLHLNTMLVMEDEYMHSPNAADSSSLAMANAMTTPTKKSNKNIMTMSPACNFEAFSLHFHLPLKTAAEKFGVRATAFKKRCRAIGIRHWPYRKVRSLKRSLQELNRCKDQGALNDKQQYQYATFKKQLDKLMAPETYGIDPSGRIVHEHFDDSEDESDDSHSSTQSPRYGATFSDCNISPAEGDKTFGDFSTPAHLRALRNKHSQYMQQAHYAKSMNQHFNPEIQTSLYHLQAPQANKEPMSSHLYSKFPYGLYEPYSHETATGSSVEDSKGMMAQQQHKTHGVGSSPASSPASEDMSDHPSSGCVLDHEPHIQYNNHHNGNLMPTAEMKYEDVRSLNQADDEFTEHANHMDYNNDRFFDDVFLQISPDYGCLV
jgi:hypothetical protein